MTHTYATIEVKPAAYDQIAALLRQAAYHHAFADDGAIFPTIDMHGIGLQRAAEPRVPQCRIVAAAIRKGDSIIVGARHFDTLMRNAIHESKVIGWPSAEQGFVDQRGIYLSRTAAWTIALAAGQIIRRCGGDETDGGTLYSENLY